MLCSDSQGQPAAFEVTDFADSLERIARNEIWATPKPPNSRRLSENSENLGQHSHLLFVPVFITSLIYRTFPLRVIIAVLACFLRRVAYCPAAEGGKLGGQDDGFRFQS
jgi:hypothetical protein